MCIVCDVEIYLTCDSTRLDIFSWFVKDKEITHLVKLLHFQCDSESEIESASKVGFFILSICILRLVVP